MRGAATVVAFFIIVTTAINMKSQDIKPDFAFPQQVVTDSKEEISKSLQKKDYVSVLRNALNYVLSSQMISNDSVAAHCRFLDSLTNELPMPYSALTKIMEASVINSYYQSDAWTYNRRMLPLEKPFPLNISEWSREMFADTICSLLEDAFNSLCNKGSVNEFGKISLDEFKSLFVYEKPLIKENSDNPFKLTLFDFLAIHGAKILSEYSGNTIDYGTIPFFPENNVSEESPSQRCNGLKNRLIDTLIESNFQAGNYVVCALGMTINADGIMQETEKSDYIKNGIIKLKDTEGLGILYKYFWNNFKYEINLSSSIKDFYNDLEKWMRLFPKSLLKRNIEWIIAEITDKKIDIKVPDIVLPDTEWTIEVNNNNMNEAYILVYQVKDEDLDNAGNLIIDKFDTEQKPLLAIPIKRDENIPFKISEDIRMPGFAEGYYAFIISKNKNLSKNWKKENKYKTPTIVNFTSIAVFTVNDSGNKKEGFIYVVDAKNQKPISGAKVNLYKAYAHPVLLKSLVTGEDGSVKVEKGHYTVEAIYGKSKFKSYQNLWYDGYPIEKREELKIFTDLSVYRKGDKVRFSAVYWKSDTAGNHILSNQKLRFILRDVNYEIVDSILLITDSLGRTAGEFLIPQTGLAGSYLIEAKKDLSGLSQFFRKNDSQILIGSQYFEVAEYKTPGFRVIVDGGSDIGFSAGDFINFKGNVATYSGMPLGGAEITYKISYIPWRFWWRNGSHSSFTGKLISEPDGSFEIELPTENLKDTPFANGIYSLVVEATSLSGETQSSGSMIFSLGEGFTISTSINEKICVDGNDIIFDVKVYNIVNKEVTKQVSYKIYDEEGKIIDNGVFESPRLIVPSKLLKSGKYKLEFSLPGMEGKEMCETVIYRKSDDFAPYKTSLWVPDTEIVASGNDSIVKVIFGDSYSEDRILYIVSDKNGIIDKGWVKMNGLNTHISVKAPQGYDKVWVSLAAMHDLKQESETVTIINEESLARMLLEVVTYRDKVTAGDKENWRFKFKLPFNRHERVPALAVMTDKALNAIKEFKWQFNPFRYVPQNKIHLDILDIHDNWYDAEFSKWLTYVPDYEIDPNWQLYGCSFGGFNDRDIVMYNNAPASLEAPRALMKTAALNDSKEETEDYEEESSASDSRSATTGESGDYEKENSEELRPVEMPLAFFKTDLISDENGNLEITFEVPDFNITWQFQLLGYNNELLTAYTLLDIVASKPVMAKGNFPLFLRTDDKTTFKAQLFNNTENELPIGGKIEIRDANGGGVLKSYEFQPIPVSPLGNRLISLDYDVPGNISAIEIRTHAFSDGLSDGEGQIVPVYPSSTPVIESTQFYSGANKERIEISLPELDPDANVTLKYCNNPLLECLLSLPAVMVPDSKSSLSWSKSLYASSVALKLVQEYPFVRSGLEKINENFDKHGITSRLEEDAELKLTGLKETPWVNNAENEKMRLGELGKLLDVSESEKKLDTMFSELKKLRNSDGGWSWFEGMKSSLFITQEVLLEFGEMKRAGAYNTKYDNVVFKAIDFCDNYIWEMYKKDRRMSLTFILEYLYIRSFFNRDFNNPEMKKASLVWIESIVKEWRKLTIREKAEAALTLHRSGKYNEIVGEILESLVQFASKDDEKGWWYDNLESGFTGWNRLLTTSMALNAFAEISPSSPAVDGLRQWLLLQKETEEWGDMKLTVQLVQSILASGSDWTVTKGVPVISLNGKPIKLPTDYNGDFPLTLNLNPSEVSNEKLTIEKNSLQPAWGGVISQFVKSMQDVEKVDCLNLSIRKQIVVLSESDHGVKAEEGELQTGDKVRITLTVTCEKDMDYVVITDNRGACVQPDEWLSGYGAQGELWGYKETEDEKTSFFFEFMPKGSHIITYDCHIDRRGDYSSGIATVQSLYAPQNVAHSAGSVLDVK